MCSTDVTNNNLFLETTSKTNKYNTHIHNVILHIIGINNPQTHSFAQSVTPKHYLSKQMKEASTKRLNKQTYVMHKTDVQ